MAWQVKFLNTATNLNVTAEPNSSQEIRTYLVYEDSDAYDGSADTTWTIYNLSKGTSAPWDTVPKVGARLYPGSADLNARQLIVDSVDVELVSDRRNTWRILVRSSAPLVGNKSYASVRLQYQQRNRVADVYINPTSYPANGDAVYPPTSLITGTLVNVMGEPLRVNTVGAAIIVEATYNPAADANGHWMTTMPATLDIINRAHRRNSAAWLSFPIGSVVFLGYEERELTNQVIQVSWTFAYDGASHLMQIPYRRPTDGGLWVDALYPWGGGGNQAQATSKAAWFQPYSLTKVDFNTAGQLFPQEVIDALAAPYPAW